MRRYICTLSLILFLLFWLPSAMIAQQSSRCSLTTEDGLSGSTVWSILRDKQGYMYFGTDNGVDRYDGNKIVNILFPKSEKVIDGAVCLQEKDHRHILVKTPSGTWMLDKKKLTLQQTDTHGYEHRNGNVPLPWGRYPSACTVYRDVLGMKWAGYQFFGLDYQPYSSTLFSTIQGNKNVHIRSFLKDGQRILLGTRGGLECQENGHTRLVSGAGSIISQIKRCDHSYFVGTIGEGLRIIDVHSFMVTRKMLDKANVYQILVDAQKRVWVCSSAGLLCYGADGSSHLYSSANSQLPDDEVFCMDIDSRGNGWISTRGGMAVYDNHQGVISCRKVPETLKRIGLLRSIQWMDADRMIVIPMQGIPALYRLREDRLSYFNFDIYEDTPSFQTLVPIGQHGKSRMADSKDNWLFTTTSGLYLYTNGQLRKFGYIDGLPSAEFQSHALEISADGVLWAATNQGLVSAPVVRMIHLRRPHIPIILSEIQTDHWFTDVDINEVMDTHQLQLSRHINDVALRFSPLLYGNTRDIRYRYRLEGDDNQWYLANHNATLFFHGLMPGNYTLYIEAIGIPELSLKMAIIVPLTTNTILWLILILLITVFAGHIAYCKYYKKPYFWERFMPKPEKYQNSRMDKEESELMLQKLHDYMEQRKPYLKSDLQMSDLAKAMDCSTHTMSQLFSLYMERSYYDYISEWRVNEFKKRAKDTEYAHFTITALSEMCGFRSRNTFSQAFRKFTGMTPKEYLRDSSRS
mgnify:CR=1 FL=1